MLKSYQQIKSFFQHEKNNARNGTNYKFVLTNKNEHEQKICVHRFTSVNFLSYKRKTAFSMIILTLDSVKQNQSFYKT